MNRSLISIATAVLVLAASACGGSGSGSETTKDGKDVVDIGAISIVDTAPVHIAEREGYFDKHGIQAEISSVQGGAGSVTGVVSGQFDFGFANTTSLLTAREQGLPLRAVANGVASTGTPKKDFSAVVVQPDSPVRDAADLQGRKVAVNQLQNIGDTTIRASVRKAGGDPEGVEFVEMPFPDMPAALEKGRVDAVWVVEPFLSQALETGARAVAWNFAEATDDLTVALYFTTEQKAREDPDLVERFTAAMNEALRYADAHPEEVRDVLATYTEIPARTIDRITLPRWPTEVNGESVQDIARLARDDGVLTKDVDVGALLP